MKKINNDVVLRIRILNKVLNYIQKRGWIDYDDFSLRLTDRVLNDFKKGRFNIHTILRRFKANFFRLNGISKEEFLLGNLESQLLQAWKSQEVIKAEQIRIAYQVHDRAMCDQIFVDDIDSFSEVRNIKPEDVRSFVPLNLKERLIKFHICEIIGEVYIPNDWGGEKSDLFTDLMFGGKRVPTAFMLKGRGTKGKLTLNKCGKNGDQVLRLVEEPATIFIVQHIDEIDSSVIQLLELALNREAVSRRKRLFFCVMDGVDIARLLRAYGKIGS